jgi:uncharacterized membrane protein YdjX (TVP38/TMEM64 family)
MIKHVTKSSNRIYLIMLFTVLGSLYIIFYIARKAVDIERLVKMFGIAAPFASIALYGIFSVTPIPTDPLTVINGALFGPVVGVLVSWMGNNLAATLEYFIGKGIGSATNFEEQRKKLPFGIGKYPVDSAWYLFLGRFFPQFGGKVVSITGGMYKVPFWKYIWTAALSNFIGAIMFAVGGYGLFRLFL